MNPGVFFDQAEEYIKLLSENERIKILSAARAVSIGDVQSVYTKKLNGSVYELRVGHHRLIYFRKGQFLYFVSAFRKKTMKTPKLEIEYALKAFRQIAKSI